jgi:hypothetical protein
MLAVVAHALTSAGLVAGRVPLWSAFTAVGGVVFSGGVTVLLAGGEEYLGESAIVCDPTARRATSYWSASEILTGAEYDESALPVRAASPGGTRPLETRTAPAVPKAPPRDAPAPTPAAAERTALRSSDGVAQTIREVETALDEILQAAQRPAPDPVRRTKGPARPSPAVGPTEVTPPAPPPKPTGRIVEPTRGIPPAPPAKAVGRVVEPVLPLRPLAAPPACVTCGSAILTTTGNESCTVCGDPLCAACEGRARAAGHKGICPNCERLLFRSGGPT